MRITTVGNYLHKIVRAVSLSSTAFIFTTILMQSLQAQDPNDPLDTHIPPREHQEFLRKAREGEVVRPGTSQQQHLRLAQIREDFRRIQLVNADKIRPALTANTFDYKSIAKASSEIERSAVRLKSNLALPDSGEKSSEADNDSATYLDQMKRLDTLIWSFVSNSIFRNTEVIDVQLAEKASRDLHEIIKVSEWLKRRHN
ncbi:MAG TPA: hypothetical protein VLR90_14985 [Blastocatellia bacterium]|nr:hypothetical protein [Blastocatellia bacterium]